MELSNLFNIKDKHILLTGASGELGQAILEDLISGGAIVYAITSNDLSLKPLIYKYGDKLKGYSCDLLNKEKTKKVCKEITDDTNIDIIINCAGITIDGNIDEIDSDNFYKVFNLNLFAVYRVIKYLLPSMKKNPNGGVILNISSALGERAVPNCIAYSTSKLALIHFSKCLALELAPWKIRVNTISPGYFISKINEEVFNGENAKAYIQQKIPLNRLIDKNELIPLIRLIISDAGSYMTGANLVIDGGLSNW